MHKPFLSVLIIFTIVTSCFSCMSTEKFVAKSELDSAKVPTGFDPKKHVLLIAEMPQLNNPEKRSNGVTGKLEKALQAYFPYKYEIVSAKEITGNLQKYADTSVYKYALLNSLSVSEHTTTTTYIRDGRTWSTSPSARTAYIDFAFYDRTNKQRYPNTGNGSSIIKYPVAALGALVKKTKG